MRYGIMILLGISLAMSLNSCSDKTESCPAFDNTFLNQWFPYTANQSIVFQSADSNVQNLTINRVEYTEPHTVGYGAYRQKQYCNVKGTITSKQGTAGNDITLLLTHVEQDEDNQDNNKLELRFNDMFVRFQLENGFNKVLQSDEDIMYSITAVTQADLNGAQYDNVRLVEAANETVAANNNMDKLYIAEGKGIIGFRVYPSKEEFWIRN